ncbi:MAG: DUF1924 domain-containing protein [Pseudomonadota bacterium]
MRKWFAALSLLSALPAFAATPEALLQHYTQQARQENPAFSAFSAERGRQFYQAEHRSPRGEAVSCATCHTADPRRPGRTRANKVIQPLAPAINGERLTDLAKAEKWFRRNCHDVLGRECTAQEKGDFVRYLLSVK